MSNKLIFDYLELINLNYYKVVFKPFYCDNFSSNILTNIIRQSLFINTEGFSVTEVCFKNVKHEYGYIPGVKEDILNIILNIKGLIFKLKNTNKTVLNVFSNKNIVTGKDVKLNKFSKILNPNHIICNLSSKFSNISFKIKIEKGKGFIPFSSSKNYRINKKWKNGILLDSHFCPILRVSYLIKDLSYINNFKIFIFFIETNGVLSAKKAILNSLSTFFSGFSNFKMIANNFNNFDNFVCYFSIFDLNFSFRTIKIFLKLNILKINDLIKCTKSYLLNFKFVTKKTIFEINNILELYNLKLL